MRVSVLHATQNYMKSICRYTERLLHLSGKKGTKEENLSERKKKITRNYLCSRQ